MPGPHLGGIAVNGLLAAEDDADLVAGLLGDPLDGGGQYVAGGEGVGAAEAAVGAEDRLIGAHGQRLLEGGFGIGRSHGERHRREAVAVLDPQPLFQGVGVIGVDDERDTLPHEGVGYRIDLDLGGIRNLFDAGNGEHAYPPARQGLSREGGGTVLTLNRRSTIAETERPNQA